MEDIQYEKILSAMKDEIEALKKDHPNPAELDDFLKIYKRFLIDKDNKIKWDGIAAPKGKIVDYSALEDHPEDGVDLLSKLAVLKLNGGLGTTMGMKGPKSAIQIKNGKNFIDLITKQLKYLGEKYNTDIPLVLMNSFNTEEKTKKLIKHHNNIRTIKQSMYPRISAEDLMPIAGDQLWYPPGHGDLFRTLITSGMLDELLSDGKEYLFISNIDNLAATVDLKILRMFSQENLDFCMEVTDKTRADVKGGTLIDYNDVLTLLEIAQVPSSKKSEFTSIRKFKIFNTNSIWIKLNALKEIDPDEFALDIIQNRKTVCGEPAIQLETAMGAAIKHFKNNCGVLVPRSRFLPIKTCSDLFLVESNLFEEHNGYLNLTSKRMLNTDPIIKLLGNNFSSITMFEESFEGIPDIVDLEILTVVGNVTFGKNVVLRGIVIIMATEGSSIHIPEGSILDDKVISGNFTTTTL